MAYHKNINLFNMAYQNSMSESEEMYLVTIARLREIGIESPVPLSRLAEEMQILPVSANQMIRKLAEAGLVAYTPYKGAELTGSGQRRAAQILRQRRLWATFLMEHLGYSVPEADMLACRLEHIFPEESAERLAEYLGRPVLSPDGKPIPEAQSGYLEVVGFPLTQLAAGEQGEIVQIQADEMTRAFLASEGILPGVKLTMLALGSHGASLVRITEDQRVHLSQEVANCLRVKLSNN